MNTKDLENLSIVGNCFQNEREYLGCIKETAINQDCYVLGYHDIETNGNDYVRCNAILTYKITIYNQKTK